MTDQKSDTELNFPELADDIRSIVNDAFVAYGEKEYVTKEELETLRKIRDEERNELGLSIESLEKQINDIHMKIDEFKTEIDFTLEDIKKNIKASKDEASRERLEVTKSVREMQTQNAADKKRVSAEMDTLRNSVENTDDRVTEIQKMAHAAMEVAHKTQVEVLSKINPLHAFLFGDETRKSLLELMNKANSELDSKIASNNNQLIMLIQSNNAKIEQTRKEIQPTIDQVNRLNNHISNVINWSRSSVGRTALVLLLGTFLSGTPFGDAVIALVKAIVGT
jgi:methyl-accepting chemotaxis protein